LKFLGEGCFAESRSLFSVTFKYLMKEGKGKEGKVDSEKEMAGEGK
jgi:hypothetical protein